MFLTLDSGDKRSLYQQIIDGVKALIARGELREGSTLPSVRQLAADLGVNLNTIAFAYRCLQEEGFLEIRHGAGTVLHGPLLASAFASLMHVGQCRALVGAGTPQMPVLPMRSLVAEAG